MTYKIEELVLPKNDNFEEQQKARKIFEDLKNKINSNIKITEHEKDFF